MAIWAAVTASGNARDAQARRCADGGKTQWAWPQLPPAACRGAECWDQLECAYKLPPRVTGSIGAITQSLPLSLLPSPTIACQARHCVRDCAAMLRWPLAMAVTRAFAAFCNQRKQQGISCSSTNTSCPTSSKLKQQTDQTAAQINTRADRPALVMTLFSLIYFLNSMFQPPQSRCSVHILVTDLQVWAHRADQLGDRGRLPLHALLGGGGVLRRSRLVRVLGARHRHGDSAALGR